MNAIDTRVVYGARCSWWDSISEASSLPGRLPCCPRCKGMLFEMDSEDQWWKAVQQYAEQLVSDPDYVQFIEWSRGKCFPGYEAAREAFDAERGQ